jgi:hypothetical protein
MGNLGERLDRWKRRARRAGDADGSGEAAEEHRRYEEATGDDAARSEEDGALGLDEGSTRHDTPPGTEQTPG